MIRAATWAWGACTLVACAETAATPPQAPPATSAPAHAATSPASAPSPAPAADTTSPAAEAPAPTLGAAWETKRWRVAAAITPERDGFPVGLVRAATRVCLEDELHLTPSAETLTLELTFKEERIRGVTRVAQGATPTALPATLLPCLERQYAKIRVSKPPPKLALVLDLTPAD